MFTTLSIEGFRRIGKLDLELRRLGVIIGPNSSGKTSLLEAISLLASAARGRLSDEVSRMNGLRSFLTADARDHLVLDVTRNLNGTDEAYVLDLGVSGQLYEIRSERLWTGLRPPDSVDGMPRRGRQIEVNGRYDGGWSSNSFEADLAAAPRSAAVASSFRDALASFSYHHLVNVAPRSPGRSPELIQPPALPGNQGENLAASLHGLRDTDRIKFLWLEEILSVAFPGFDRIEFPVVASGTIGLSWRDKRFPNRPFGAHELSDGALRFLWLASILVSPNLGAMTMIDEPELSLHPDLLKLLVEMIREASHRTQILIATQSEQLVRFLNPTEVVVAEDDEGFTRMTWGDKIPDLDRWLADYSLDELWRMGELRSTPT